MHFEEVQRELQVLGGVSFFSFSFFFPGRGITSGFTQIAKMPKPDDVRCRITPAPLQSSDC